ncbi:uncharacterized protein LOC123566277 [Mercenaria mercenaria]|uniref:uncharacterized protein LOC123566277 n=1 Tax=Mercenaria mercenaria TaxID=6596 RepID=UPI00234FA8AB|nr:uncharacterized protein LOC123566277 [Mercenaria mercenaria]XP_053406037.1 uncharacterized protein LOC123566277 [Mercenaria mercenaria]
MVGQHNSVLSRVREQQPNVYDLGCVCHIANTCVQHALKKLTTGVVDLLIDTFYYFLHSSKTKEEYQGFVDFVELEDPGKLLKHCPTRWISLHKCVKQSLVHWPALKSYFDSQPEVEKKGSRVKRCASKLHDEVLYMTYLFLDYILEPIIGFNTTFQANEAMVGYLHPEMKRFFKTMLSKFVKIRVITSATNVTKVDFKNPDNLAVGMGVREYLSSNPDIDSRAVETFFKQDRLGSMYCCRQDRLGSMYCCRQDRLGSMYCCRQDRLGSMYCCRQDRLGSMYCCRQDRLGSMYCCRQDRLGSMYSCRQDQLGSMYCCRQDQLGSMYCCRQDQLGSMYCWEVLDLVLF